MDEQLAHLFTTVSIDSKTGVERARSASEAFLYRRLECLPETRGRFQLNVELPVPFGGSGHMEIDLLCADALIAIEIDDEQHFSDMNAYRSDRKKRCFITRKWLHGLRYSMLYFLTPICS